MRQPLSGDLPADQARQGLFEIGAGASAAVLVSGDRIRIVTGGEDGVGGPVSPTTPFHICSCSKTFTAATFARLVQEGVAGWDDPVRDIVPEFLPLDAHFAGQCTFRDLAAMRLGLGRAGIAEWGFRQDMARSERLKHGRHIERVRSFRDGFSYSNLCYIALGLAAERLSGRPYADLVRDLVCNPLGMTRTASIAEGVPADAATPQMPVMGRMVEVRELTGPNSEGSARIHMSADDAAIWIRFLVSALRAEDDAPLSTAVRDMARPWSAVAPADIRQAPDGDGQAAYGMGLAISRLRGEPLLRHGGGGRGWRHALALAPDRDVGVMVMAAAETPAVEGLALELLETVAWGDSRDWRGSYEDAATRAAAMDRAAIDAEYPACPAPASSLQPGLYANAASGTVRIETGASGLRLVPERAPDLTAGLRQVGPEVFDLDFDEPALHPQPLDLPFRLRVTSEDGRPVLDTTYFGQLRRAG